MEGKTGNGGGKGGNGSGVVVPALGEAWSWEELILRR